MTTTQKTPGYNCRLRIAFAADKNGTPIAYYWSGRGAIIPGGGRWIKMGLEAARLFVAQEQADQVVK